MLLIDPLQRRAADYFHVSMHNKYAVSGPLALNVYANMTSSTCTFSSSYFGEVLLDYRLRRAARRQCGRAKLNAMGLRMLAAAVLALTLSLTAKVSSAAEGKVETGVVNLQFAADAKELMKNNEVRPMLALAAAVVAAPPRPPNSTPLLHPMPSMLPIYPRRRRRQRRRPSF